MGINWESKVLSSMGNVIDNAQHITISEKQIEIVADWLAYEEFGLPKNNKTNKDPDNFIRTTMLINTLNFAFTDFDTSIKYSIERDGQKLSDSEAMFTQVNEAIDSGIDLLNGEVLEKLTIEELEKRPEAKNLIGIYSSLTNNSFQKSIDEFAGKNFSKFKEK